MQEKERQQNPEPVAEIAVPVCVVLAERNLAVSEILELHPGSILDLGRDHESSLELNVNGSRVGRGHAIDVGDRLAFLLEEVDGPAGKASPGPRS